MIKGAMYTSAWEYGTVKTHCKLNTETGEVFDIEQDDSGEDRGTLIQEYIELDDEVRDVCMICHSHILVSVMQDNLFDKCLNEEWQCMNPDCESNQANDLQ